MSSFATPLRVPLLVSLFAALAAVPASSVHIAAKSTLRPSLGASQVHLVADQWKGAGLVRRQDGWCSWHQLVRARAMAPGSSISSAQLQACMELTRWPSEDCRAEKGKRIRLRTISGITYCIPVARQRRVY